MRLRRYLERLRDIIYSRQEIEVEYLRVEEVLPDRLGAIGGRFASTMIRYWHSMRQ